MIRWHTSILKITVVLMSFCMPSVVLAQKIAFERITTKDGLSQGTITSICQDSAGFMWFSTGDGLNRYDGSNFVVFKNDPKDSTTISNNSIRALLVDQTGTLWIGTYGGGLNCYHPETETFSRYQHNPDDPNSISHDNIFGLFQDHSGTIWIATWGGGMNKMVRKKQLDKENNKILSDNIKFVHFRHDPSNPNTIAHDKLTSFYEDKDGMIWIGTRYGLNKFNPKTEQFIGLYKHKPDDENSLSDDNISALCGDQLGNIWIGTWGEGLNVFDPSKNQFYRFVNEPNNPRSISYNILKYLYCDKSGNIWIGTWGGGLNKIAAKHIEELNKGNEPYFARHQHNKNDIWSIIGNTIYSVYEDRSGVFWIGTAWNGLSWHNTDEDQFVHYQSDPGITKGLQDDAVSALVKDKNGILWIGTTGGGVNTYNQETNRFQHFSHDANDLNSLSSNGIRAIIEDRAENIWIGTDYGFNKYNRKTRQFKRYFVDPNEPDATNVNCIYEDKYGLIWIGKWGTGIAKFNPISEVCTNYTHDPNDSNSVNGNIFTCVAEDNNGQLWIGTEQSGLNRFERETNQFFHYKHDENDPTSLSSNTVNTIMKDSKGDLLIGTSEGVDKMIVEDNTVKFESYKVNIEGRSNSVLGIVETDDGNLWLIKKDHLLFLDQNSGKKRVFDGYARLRQNEFLNNSVYRDDKTDEIYVGGINGFNIFHPDKIAENPVIPNIVINSFKIFNKSFFPGDTINGRIILNKSIVETDKITLSYKENVFSFEFAALHFNSPKDNKYAYKMDGFEEDWNEVDNKREATYTNLDPGEYTFRVKASNNDGVWNEEGTSVRIVILPPFWETWWFISLVLLFIAISAYFFYRYKTNSIQRQKKLLEKVVRERTAEISKKNAELEKLSIVASKTDNAITIMDAQGNFEWFNNAYVKLYGYELEEFKKTLGKNIIEISTNRNIQSLINQCIRNKKTATYECESYSKTGNKIWTHVTITPILNIKNNVAKLISIESDIKKLKEYEIDILNKNEELAIQQEAIEKQNKELEKHRNHLQKLVDEQTKELKAALYKAKESDRLKSTFLANMSHEIRTPMNAIIGFSEILIKTNKDETQTEYLNSIKLSGQTLLSLINDILDLSKIEAGKMTIKKDVISLKSIFSELKHIFKVDAELKGLNLFTEVDENLPEFVELDELRTRQVLINLINNAIKFTHKGYIKVKAKAEFIQGEVNLIISVQDTGIGIKKSDQERIFEAFNQSDSYDRRNYEGTGLGLAIISRIVPLLGGTIKLNSEINKGSSFIIEIKDVKIHKENPVSQFREIIDPDSITFEAGTVLVVDDKDINIEVAKGLLKPYNLKVIEARSGIEAIDVAMLKKPDLILMDLKMKEMSGYEATKFLKSDEKTRNIPVVVLTASVLGFNENMLDEYKFSGYLPKPVELDLLVTELSRFLPHKIAPKSIQENIVDTEVNLFEENDELKNYLKKHVLNTWKQVQKSRTSILEKEFALQIIKAGQLFKNKYLEEKGRSLKSAIKSFNFEKFTTVQDELSSIFKTLT